MSTRALTFFFFALISRFIAPADFGVMALALIFALLIDTLVDQGLSDAIIQRAELNDTHSGTVLVYQICLSIIAAILILSLAPQLSRILKEPKLAEVLPWISLACIFNALGFARLAIYRRTMQFKVLAIRNFLATFLGGIIGLWYAYQGAGLKSLVIMHVLNAFSGAIVLWVAEKSPFKLCFRLQSLRELLSFARSVLGVRLIEVAASRLDQVLVGQYFGAAVLGYYALAVRLYEILIQTTAGPVSEVAYPLFSKLQNDKNGLGRAYLRLLQYAGGITIPLFIGASLTAATYIPLFFGEQWNPSTPYLLLILAFGAITSINTYNDVIFGALGRPDLRLKLAATGIVLWLCSALVLLPLGPMFVAITWCLRAILMYPIRLFFALRLMELESNKLLPVFLPQVVACCFMGTGIYFIQMIPTIPNAAKLFLEIIVGGSVYMLVLHLMASPLPRQLLRIKQAINE